MIPINLTLETNKVLLRPLAEEDYHAFRELAIPDPAMWEYFSLNLADELQLKKWMQAAFDDRKANTRRPFTIIDKQKNKIAGSSSLGNISLHDRRVEIGWSWLGKDFRNTGINMHAKFVMMKYTFEELDFERVEFKTDVLNARAREGLKKIGGKEEGILRSHMTMWNNRRRNSIYYSVIKKEWPGLLQTVFAGIIS